MITLIITLIIANNDNNIKSELDNYLNFRMLQIV